LIRSDDDHGHRAGLRHLDHPPVTFRLDVTVRDAVDALADNGVTAAPVADENGRLVGMVTDTELLDDWLASRVGSRTAGDVLTRTVITLPATAELSEVATAMMLYDATSVRLIRDGAAVGILSRTEVVRGAGLAEPGRWEGVVNATAERHALRHVAGRRDGVPSRH